MDVVKFVGKRKLNLGKPNLVSAPKIEAESDVKVIPQVKVEMTSSGSTLTNVEFEICEKLYNKNNDLNTLYMHKIFKPFHEV